MEQLILQFMIRASQQKKKNAYHLYGTSGNSEENSNGTVHPLEMFSAKKGYTFRGIRFPAFTGTTEIFGTICLDYQRQAFSREKDKNLPVFCK